MLKEDLKKYRGIFISLTVFMLFFVGYLFVNSALQSTTSKAAQYSSFVSELSIKAQQLGSPTAVNSSVVRSGLELIQQGGPASLANGSKIDIEPIGQFIKTDAPNVSSIQAYLNARDYAEVEIGVSNLAKAIDQERAKKVKLVETLQIIAGIFTFMLYVLITVVTLKRLSQSEQIEEKTKQEAEGILNTVSEGLFLLGRDHEIGIEQSASLKDMFKQERDLEGNFFDFISQFVTQGDLQIAKDYLELLFGDRVKEKLVASLNPLNNVEINIVRRDGTFEQRYLDFSFKRVVEGGELKHLLGSVTDVTRQVLLERELAEAKEQQEAQIDLLKSILHVDNTQLKAFFKTAEEGLNRINQTLESHDRKLSDGDIRTILAQIAEDVHKIKGDSAALGLHQFEFSAHSFEDTISDIQSSSARITGKELLPLTTNLRGMFKELENMTSLIEKFSGAFAKSSAPNKESAVNETSESTASTESGLKGKLHALATTVSERNDTRVQLSAFGLAAEDIPKSLEEDINSIAVQLVRNAVVHGAQTPAQRLNQGKPDFMSLAVSLTRTSRGYEILVRDDGKGIDAKQVVSRAADLGLAKESDVASASIANCIKYLFHPKFSSESVATLDAGRGVGLPLVRRILKERDGKISVKSETGRYCQFHIVLPIAREQAA